MKFLSATSIFLSIAAAFLLPAPAPAGDAVFSRNGKSIYQRDSRGEDAAVNRLSLDAGTIETITVPGIPDDQEITNLARSNAGFILCLTDAALYAWNDEKGSDAVVVSRAPERGHFVEVAYDPAGSTIAIVTRLEPKIEGQLPEWTLFALFKGDEDPVRIRCRRVRAVSGMTFDGNGILHFGTEGDLWQGKIVRDEDFGYLNAYRHTPLATRETNMGTSSQMGADTIETTADHLYVHVRRMGGSGWGHVIRLRKPAIPKSEEGHFSAPFELPDRLEIYRKQLKTVEILGENGTYSHLCVSPDGQTVYFRARRDPDPNEKEHWLVRDGGKPESISVSEGG